MSKYSGKCDFADNLLSSGKDEMEAFIEFKMKTGGVIYQYRKVTVTELNREWVSKRTDLTWSNHAETVKTKSGATKEVLRTSYMYYGKEYADLRKLNKKGVYVKIEIPFDTLLDVIPYYPYTFAAHAWSGDHETAIISDKPAYMSRFDDALDTGLASDPRFPTMYMAELQNHYIDVVNRYYKDGSAS